MKKKVIIGMSGGVDSSVSAWILKKNGYNVIGLFIKSWEDDNEKCSIYDDILDVVSVADIINIDLKIVNFVKEYKEYVFNNFIDEYLFGKTPNPDILCNFKIKFKVFFDYAKLFRANFVATGHYANINKIGCEYKLFCAFDKKKDQSYFLYRLTKKQLSKIIFPLGKIKKKYVRSIAIKIGLPNALKKDSTGICFIEKKKFRNFLCNYIQSKPGLIKTISGEIIGKHIGLSFYTYGQRSGIGIGGIKNKNNKPWFVSGKDLRNNILYVSQNKNNSWLLSYKLIVENFYWISGYIPKDNNMYYAKIRYIQKFEICSFKIFTRNFLINKSYYEFYFISKQWAVSPGQSIVIYNKDVCLGGGIIKYSLTFSKIANVLYKKNLFYL